MNTAAGTTSIGASALPESGFRQLLRARFNDHGLFLGISLAYLAAYKIVDATVPGMAGVSGLEIALGFALVSIPISLLALVLLKFAELAVYERPKHPIVALWRNVVAVLKDREKMAAGLPMYLALLIFIYVFGLVKANITVFKPFSWDMAFDRWDTFLHFGYRPWELLHPVLGYWPATALINFNYNLWFMLMNGFWVYYGFLARPGEERTRFFLTFMLTWMIGGGVLAVFFSSAGPCFLTRLGIAPDPYADLMAYLRQANETIPIWAVATQDMLWGQWRVQSAFGGISAMPSMHNATALLFILTSAGRPLWLRRLLWLHAALIFLGSIHLGWHYAVDAYLAWGLVIAVWMAAGPLARWWERTRLERPVQFQAGY